MIERYRRWFEYEKDAHAKTLASLHAVPPGQRSTDWFRKAVDLVAHIVTARRMWLFRLGFQPERPPDLFPKNMMLEELGPAVEDMQALWSGYLAQLDDTQLARVFDYLTYEGDPYRNTVEDILTQLFGHSSYHRGQIAMLLRGGGAQPAETDFVFWTRERISEAVADVKRMR